MDARKVLTSPTLKAECQCFVLKRNRGRRVRCEEFLPGARKFYGQTRPIEKEVREISGVWVPQRLGTFVAVDTGAVDIFRGKDG